MDGLPHNGAGIDLMLNRGRFRAGYSADTVGLSFICTVYGGQYVPWFGITVGILPLETWLA